MTYFVSDLPRSSRLQLTFDVAFSDELDNDSQLYVFIDEYCGVQEEIAGDTLEIFGNGIESKGLFFRK